VSAISGVIRSSKALATKFVAALHDVSLRNPASWRRVSAIVARTGIKGAELDQVVADAVATGLVEHRVDNPSLVSLTNKGWHRKRLVQCRSTRSSRTLSQLPAVVPS
jgi:hypothetical protein